MMKTVAIIPARGGSRRIPGKNLRMVAGKPLLAHTVCQAVEAGCIDRTCVSTDSPEIASVATHFGAAVIWRPAELADDLAPSESALAHALRVLREEGGGEYDTVVFLQCTCPVRRPYDISRAVEKLHEEGADSLLSVVRSQLFIWSLRDGVPSSVSYDFRERRRTQDMDPLFVENGSIYVFKPWVLEQHGNRLGGRIAFYEMDRRSLIDVDDESDIAVCRSLLETQ